MTLARGAITPVRGSTFNEHRNTSRVFAVPPHAHKEALASLERLRRDDPALVRWIEDGHPTLTAEQHLSRFGAPYSVRPRKRT